MMLIDHDQCEPEEVEDLSVFPSLYAYSAYATRHDETPIDAVVRFYYLDLVGSAA